jgi:hypothetical protein
MTTEGPVLRDIHVPADPSWWPPAPGWWLLAALAVVVTLVVVRRLSAANRARNWRRRIVAELDPIASRHADTPDDARLAGELSVLLRRAARVLDPSSPALRGEAWLRFLDARLGGDDFERGVGRVLLDAPWRKTARFDASALVALVRRWVEHAFARERPHA